MISDTNLLIFKAISNFVTDLAEIYSTKQHSLALYNRLIEKTTIVHEGPIEKHIACFRKFCEENADQIITRETTLTVPSIKYSEKVQINLQEIFEIADNETKETIWDHILTISALVDPTSKAKQVLKEKTEKKSDSTNEANFLSDIFKKVEDNVKPDSDPMSAISGIMQSGVFTELVSGMQNGMQNGELDIGKLMGTVQEMVADIGGNTPEGGQTGDMLNMMTGMMSNLGNLGGMQPGKKSDKPLVIKDE